MAQHKNGSVNKSQAIRDYLAQHPKASAQDVVAALGAQGIKIAAGLVYMVKSKPPKRGKRTGTAPVVRRVSVGHPSSGNPIDYLLKVKSLADEGGGVEKLKQLLDAMG